MRVKLVIALGVIVGLTAVPATAQNQMASTQNQAAPSDQKAPPAKSRKVTKPAGDKICKRLSQGKVCLTAEQWKAYQEQF